MAFVMRVILGLFLFLLFLLIFWTDWENVGGAAVIILCKVLITNIIKRNINVKEVATLTLVKDSHPIHDWDHVPNFGWLHKYFILHLPLPPRQESHYRRPIIIELKKTSF